ncbi:B12-binding domain-containing radical SAM protein [Alkaliphilus peptidifermentans]|uniref:Radical SAM superfamily enzyme YgiQ, UPF0313 family n=1 Tax=Alkaliphilus peptidifermentans DSM 18978 TaxID=1120976 RepID=A0A1G5K5F2_9FIRM|nr:radical SAM protein [Alkaliphilus peptidifermentans]SCY95895.1 Radical SAM superfamily enzyme YgiQ, UPF0313 family [Alkaliphilus peptidifermentans DSM 18978]
MDIVLVFPPLGNHEHAHIGLPLLKAYLNKYGHSSSIIKDYNVEIMDKLIRDFMSGDTKTLFSKNSKNVSKNYTLAQEILRGRNQSDKLKTSWATDMIYKYMAVAGDCISTVGFDPISFKAVEEEFLNVNEEAENNPVYKYIREAIVPDIIEKKPSIVGFSLTYASQVLYTMSICRQVRKINPNIKFFFGGPIASIFWRAFMKSSAFAPYFDGIIREQGEVAVLKLCDYWIKKKGRMDEIPNLAYRDEEGIIKENPIGENCPMDDIPMPDFSDMPLELYAYPKLPFQMTRGCYWGRCAFCGHRGCNSKYMVANKKKVVDEIKALKEQHDIRMFHFADDAILPKYFVDVAKLITDEGLDIVYSVFLRTEKGFSKENCQILFKSGLRSVLFGIESANTRILNLMEKGMDTNTMKQVLRNFMEAGISNHLSCIIGFPTEEKHEAYETLQFLLDNKDIYHKAYITPFGLFSDMVDQTERFSIEKVDIYNPLRHDIDGYVAFEYSYNRNQGMSVEEYLEVLKEARKLIDSVPPGANYFSKSL